MTVVSTEGAELHCKIEGDGGSALLIPSAIGTRPYERQIPRKLGEHLQLVFVDLRGSGRSSGNPSDLTFDLLARDLEAVRNHLGVRQVAVLGHSILGVLAIEYGRRHPSSVSHVVAVGTPPKGAIAWLLTEGRAFFERDASDERKRVLRDNVARLGPAAGPRESVLAQPPMRFFDPAFDPSDLFSEADADTALLRHIMGNLAYAWDIRDGAESLRVPMLLALGRHDYVVPHVV